jgi:hypothetical protein
MAETWQIPYVLPDNNTTPESSGNSPVDTGDGGGFDWNNLVSNAGSLLGGAASLAGALGGKPAKPGTPTKPPGNPAKDNTIWYIIAIVIIVLVVLVIVLRK